MQSVAQLRRQFPLLASQPSLHFLDSAATSQVPQCVLDALQRYEGTSRANVMRGVYPLAEAASEAYEGARESVRRFINAGDAREVVFTGGTTSSINLFAHSFGERIRPGDVVVLSAAEHHSNLVPWQWLCERRGARLVVLPLAQDGRIDLCRLGDLITEQCRVVAITHCSNVTGAITDLRMITRRAHDVGAIVLVDGAQSVLHGPVDVSAIGIDAYAFSGHKCFGPNGVGVLWARRELLETMPPWFGGGGMVGRVTLTKSHPATEIPRRFEAGTPPIAQAVGLAAALDWMMDLPWPEISAWEQRLGQRLLNGLAALPDVAVIGPLDWKDRQPIISFNVGGIHSHDLVQALAEYGVCVRGGHQCAQPLHDAFGVDSSVRASLALYNHDANIDCLLNGLEAARRILR